MNIAGEVHLESDYPFVNPASEMSGAQLTRRLQGQSPARRAAFATRLIAGGVGLRNLTGKQAARLCGVDRAYVSVAKQATAAERSLLSCRELSIRALCRRQAGETEIDRLIDEIGAARVLQALDRLTAPQPQAHAAE
jgi:hypothetical protein